MHHIPHPTPHHLCFLYVPQNYSNIERETIRETHTYMESLWFKNKFWCNPIWLFVRERRGLCCTWFCLVWFCHFCVLLFSERGLAFFFLDKDMAIQAQLYSENHGFPMFGSHDLIMDNGCGVGLGGFNHFSFDLQQKQQLQQQHQQLQRLQQIQNQQQRNQQNLFLDNGSFIASTLKNNPITTTTINNNSHLSMLHSQSITSQFEKQRQEIDQYLRLQVRKSVPSSYWKF